jgi:hypothetical protein
MNQLCLNFITFIGFVIFVSSCQTQNKQDEKQNVHQAANTEESLDDMEMVEAEKPIDKNYFKKFDKIELLFYPNSERAIFTVGCLGLLKDGVFQIDSVQQRIVLDQMQKENLNQILSKPSGMLRPANCYSPQNAILFYKEEKVESFIEICFKCNQSCPLSLGDKHLESLEKFFNKILKE